MKSEIMLLIFACLLDYLVGDPRSAWHPVVLIGNLISYLEKLLRSATDAAWIKRLKGGVLVLLVLTVVYALTQAGVWILSLSGPHLSLAGGALLLSFTISPRSLSEAGQEIYSHLMAGDMTQARYKTGWIVGRDTADLDTREVTRATVETVAENIVDGVISPLFFALIGGIPLAFVYRAINTMDSMLGYRNEKYIDFGKVAARLDDIANYIPARLTGLFIVVAAGILGFDAKGSLQSIVSDAAKHPSPNSGIAEAGVAGALGIQLGGLNYYGGIASRRAYMGKPLQILQPTHIQQTISIMQVAVLVFLATATILFAIL